MITIYDRAAMADVLTRDLDPRLLQLLDRRFKGLVTPWGDLTDCTEWLILEPGDTEADIVREVGFSPLVEPMEGARFGSEGFHPFWDYLGLEDGHYVLINSFGSSFAYVLVTPDVTGIMAELLELCRKHAH
jgi:hypothetical protein